MRIVSRFSTLLLALLLTAVALPASAQTYIDQKEVEQVLTSFRADNLDDLPEVYYEYYVLRDSSDNNAWARNRMYKDLGNGNIEKGRTRAKVVQLLNRVLLDQLKVGDTLVVPDVHEIDFRAYAPFPRYYPGARHFDKLFIIHKSIQAWAAYEYGQLARWGIVNTGGADHSTPAGRYNFNYKQEFKRSSLSPPGEDWDMYWVFNFHLERGMHIHQYAMPAGGPESHGCVRLVDTDAQWIYNWGDAWVTSKGDGSKGEATVGGRVLKQGTTVLILGEDPVGPPHPFKYKKRYPILTKVELPDDPYAVQPGTPQQKLFDKMRLRASR